MNPHTVVRTVSYLLVLACVAWVALAAWHGVVAMPVTGSSATGTSRGLAVFLSLMPGAAALNAAAFCLTPSPRSAARNFELALFQGAFALVAVVGYRFLHGL